VPKKSDYAKRFEISESAVALALAKKVKKLRAENGWSQAELARRVGIQTAAISHIENARGNPTLETMDALARSFGVSVSSLLQ